MKEAHEKHCGSSLQHIQYCATCIRSVVSGSAQRPQSLALLLLKKKLLIQSSSYYDYYYTTYCVNMAVYLFKIGKILHLTAEILGVP